MTTLFLVDLGNTGVAAATCAAAADPGRDPREGPRLAHVEGLAEAPADRTGDALLLDGPLARALAAAAAAGPVEVWCSSVARPARTARVGDLLRAAGLAAARVNAPCGLALALRRPETCGFDRRYAARAALARAPEGALVVDAGTALTVDAVRPASDPRARAACAELGAPLPADAAGVFLGGAIAPGPRLLAEALARGGARLFEVDARSPDAPALGRDSAAALRAGVVHGFAGAALELVRRVGDEAGLAHAPVWLTGGAAPLAEPALRAALGPRLHVARGLVLEGVALAARTAARGTP